MPSRKGRSLDAVASGQSPSVPGVEKHRWANPEPTQTGFQARYSRLDYSSGCSVEAAISLIGGKWKCVTLLQLLHGTLCFNEIRQSPANT